MDEELEKAIQILVRSLDNIAQNMNDDYIQANAKFRSEAGMVAKVIRKSSGHCCKWCESIAGTYTYPDVPQDVYRRHDNCDCTVEYVNGKVRQNVWTKKKADEKLIEYRKTIGEIREDNKKYIDVTKEWIRKATPNSHKLGYLSKVVIDDVEYIVDNKHVVMEPLKKELEVADVLVKNLGGEIYIRPRIVYPEKIQTADLLFRNELFDIKQPEGNGKHTLYGMIKGKKDQSSNFIFDLTYTKMSESEAVDQIENDIYRSKHTDFVDKIILISNKQIVRIFQKRKN